MIQFSAENIEPSVVFQNMQYDRRHLFGTLRSSELVTRNNCSELTSDLNNQVSRGITLIEVENDRSLKVKMTLSSHLLSEQCNSDRLSLFLT